MSETRTLAVIGAGNMGSGIAQKMATEGFRVILLDRDEPSVKRGLDRIRETLEEAITRKILKPKDVQEALDRIRGTTDWKRLADVDLVVEAVFEDLDVKREVFRNLAEHTRPDAILATNTSSFYVRDLAAVVEHPERVLGLHYFYHPAKNRLVEVVPADKTSDEAFRKAWAIQEAMGKTPIRCKDAPGFVVNRYFVPWLNESVRILEEGIADIPTIEKAAKDAFRIGMGPFELMNVTGVPIALHAAETLGRELGEFYAPSSKLRAQVEASENWSLDGDADAEKADEVSKRLLGVTFLVAGEIVDEGIGAVEDVDIGARVGLRWSKGPFELMNRVGVEEATELARSVAHRWGRDVPRVLERQAKSGAPFTFRLVEIHRKSDIATLTINRPDAMNAINQEVVRQLTDAFDELDRDDTIHAIVLAGKGKAFIAGADIRFFVRNIEKKNLGAIRSFTEKGHELLARFAASTKVIIARLDGLSLGGGSEIALACDWIAATPKGSFGFPETGIGIYPGLGGTQRTPRRSGIPLARWLVLTGAQVTAAAGLRLGLVDSLVAHEDLDQAIVALAERGKRNQDVPPPDLRPKGLEAIADAFAGTSLEDLLASNPEEAEDPRVGRALKALKFKAPIALRIADELIRRSAETSLAEGLAAELSHLEEIFNTEDAYEGLSSLGKARPKFKGC